MKNDTTYLIFYAGNDLNAKVAADLILKNGFASYSLGSYVYYDSNAPKSLVQKAEHLTINEG